MMLGKRLESDEKQVKESRGVSDQNVSYVCTVKKTNIVNKNFKLNVFFICF